MRQFSEVITTRIGIYQGLAGRRHLQSHFRQFWVSVSGRWNVLKLMQQRHGSHLISITTAFEIQGHMHMPELGSLGLHKPQSLTLM